MAITVSAGYLLAGAPGLPPTTAAWQAVLLLTLVTVVSRVALFMGVKRLGSVQAALLGLSELLITVLSAQWLLGEKLAPPQWLGALLLIVSVLLITRERGLGVLPAPKPWLPFVSARFAPQPEPLILPAASPPVQPPIAKPGD
jgi:drug/metabolite transporter (DMT)-like permease